MTGGRVMLVRIEARCVDRRALDAVEQRNEQGLVCGPFRHGRVDFRPVAGRQQDSTAERFAQPRDSLSRLFGRERELLSLFHRRGLMVQTGDGDDRRFRFHPALTGCDSDRSSRALASGRLPSARSRRRSASSALFHTSESTRAPFSRSSALTSAASSSIRAQSSVRNASISSRIFRAIAGLVPLVDTATIKSPCWAIPGMMKSQYGGSSTAFTQTRRSLPSAATVAFTERLSVATKASRYPSRSPAS